MKKISRQVTAQRFQVEIPETEVRSGEAGTETIDC